MHAQRFFSVGIALAMIGGTSAMSFAQSAASRPTTGWFGGPYKVIAKDFTGDGLVDLALGYVPIDVVTVERGDGHGQFSGVSQFEPPWDERVRIAPVHNMDAKDMDGDGLLDLVMGIGGRAERGNKESFLGRVVIVRNTGEGRFEQKNEYPTQSQAKGVRLADLDKDGRLDLMYTARGSGYDGDTASGKLSIRQGLGDWKFGPAIEADAGRSAYYVETGDLDNDGFLDIVVPNEHANTVTYFIHPGKELFATRPMLAPRAVTAGRLREEERTANVNDVRAVDVNGDGNLDLVTANLGPSTISIFLGRGDGSFEKDSLLDGGKDCAFLAVGDLDGDGDLDFVVAHWTEDFMSVFLNRGQATFEPRKDYRTGLGNYGVTLADLDRDGKLDAVTANYRERSISVLKGLGDGTFQPAVTTPKGLRLHEGAWIGE